MIEEKVDNIVIFEEKAPNPMKTHEFAATVSHDYNPIHREGNKPQFVSGDFLVSRFISLFGIKPGTTIFKFSGNRPILPSELMMFSRLGISTQKAGQVLKVSDDVKPADFTSNIQNQEIPNLDNIRALEKFFPRLDPIVMQIIGNYCMTSGDLYKIFDKLLTNAGYKLSDCSQIVYRSGKIMLGKDIFEEDYANQQINRSSVRVGEFKDRRGVITFDTSFSLLSNTGKPFGNIEKTIICSNLQKV